MRQTNAIHLPGLSARFGLFIPYHASCTFTSLTPPSSPPLPAHGRAHPFFPPCHNAANWLTNSVSATPPLWANRRGEGQRQVAATNGRDQFFCDSSLPSSMQSYKDTCEQCLLISSASLFSHLPTVWRGGMAGSTAGSCLCSEGTTDLHTAAWQHHCLASKAISTHALRFA